MRGNKAFVLSLLAILLVSTIACGGGEPVVSAPIAVVKDFLLAAESLDPEQMAQYRTPQTRPDMIPRFEDAFEGVKSVSNYNIHTTVVSFGEVSAHIFARWYSQTDFDDGAVVEGEAKAHFRLKKQDNKWLIWNMRTEEQEALPVSNVKAARESQHPYPTGGNEEVCG